MLMIVCLNRTAYHTGILTPKQTTTDGQPRDRKMTSANSVGISLVKINVDVLEMGKNVRNQCLFVMTKAPFGLSPSPQIFASLDFYCLLSRQQYL